MSKNNGSAQCGNTHLSYHPAIGKPRQEDYKFTVSLESIQKSCVRKRLFQRQIITQVDDLPGLLILIPILSHGWFALIPLLSCLFFFVCQGVWRETKASFHVCQAHYTTEPHRVSVFETGSHYVVQPRFSPPALACIVVDYRCVPHAHLVLQIDFCYCDKTPRPKTSLGDKRVYLAYSSKIQSIIEGSQVWGLT